VIEASEKRRHRHVWLDRTTFHYEEQAGVQVPVLDPGATCLRCGRERDEAKVTRGKSARRLGSDQERRIERVYGPRKVGEYGDAIDLIGRDFMWQSKSTRGDVPKWARAVQSNRWIRPFGWIVEPIEAMERLRSDRWPLLIWSWVHAGTRPLDIIVTRFPPWAALHHHPNDGPWEDGFMAMTGAYFLDVHGKDTP
jgi:hypothetical protein